MTFRAQTNFMQVLLRFLYSVPQQRDRLYFLERKSGFGQLVARSFTCSPQSISRISRDVTLARSGNIAAAKRRATLPARSRQGSLAGNSGRLGFFWTVVISAGISFVTHSCTRVRKARIHDDERDFTRIDFREAIAYARYGAA